MQIEGAFLNKNKIVMKRKYLLALAFSLSLGASYAQGEMDAYKFSRNDLTGTARSLSMGGAFGSYVGGDISAIAINPAAIGEYNRSEVVTTLNFMNTRMESNLGGNTQTENKFKVRFDNLAFVSTFPLQSDVAPFLNFGFSYNRLKTFDRQYSMGGNTRNSLSDYMVTRADGWQTSDLSLNSNPQAWRNTDWLPVLGFNSGLITNRNNSTDRYVSTTRNSGGNRVLTPYSQLFNQERGSINTYDFNLGTTFSDMVSFGFTVSMTDINYRMYSIYSEDFANGNNQGFFDLENWLRTDGTGWQVKTGLVFKPIHQLRIGVAYHSPTWYHMTDYYAADIQHDISALRGTATNIPTDYQPGRVESFDGNGDGITDYRLRTPDKWSFNITGVIGQRAIISADYELTNYRNNMRLHDNNGRALASGDADPNNLIEQDFRNSSTLRIGAEIRITPLFSGRVGYSWVQSPLVAEFRNNDFEVFTVGSVPHYTLDGDTHYITYGLGYRLTSHFYTDVAFVMTSQKDDLYTFSRVLDNSGNDIVTPDRISLKTNRFQGLLTLGYRF